MSLYAGQVEAYSSPVSLILMVYFNAVVAISYSFKNDIKKYIFIILNALFVFNLLITVLAGSRANFVAAILVLFWLYLSDKKIKFSKVFFGVFLILTVFLTNYIASLSGARVAHEQKTSLYKAVVEDIFYNQGITMMVFNMGIREDGYPILAYMKTIIPGVQIIFSWFDKIYQYELSFSQYLMYKLSPNLFYEGYGLAWSLLGDFYAFSFNIIFVFFLYNFLWGRAMYFVSLGYNKTKILSGLYFCFLSSVFILNRFSISSFLVLIVFYFFLFKMVKLKWGNS